MCVVSLYGLGKGVNRETGVINREDLNREDLNRPTVIGSYFCGVPAWFCNCYQCFFYIYIYVTPRQSKINK